MKTLLRYAAIFAFSYSTVWAQATNENLTVHLPGNVPLELVWISQSTFTMGITEEQKSVMDALGVSPLSGYPRYHPWEFPAHQVTLTQGFYLGKFEVTQAQWQAVMGTTPWESYPATYHGPDKPAVAMSWFEARQFTNKLNEAIGDSLYRLPTEAEWECACRGGTETFWFTGDDPEKVKGSINYFTGINQPVGALAPNPYGLYDIGGNAAEWVLDDLGTYTATTQVDPVGIIPKQEQDEVGIRGGSSGHPAYADFELLWYSRCTYRVFGQAGMNEDGHLGFRVLRRGLQATPVEESSWGQVKRK